MSYYISGDFNKDGKLIIINEADWTIEINEDVTFSGAGSFYEKTVTSGIKLVAFRQTSGEITAYGNVVPAEVVVPAGPPLAEIDVLEHQETYAEYNSLGLIDSSHFLLAYRDNYNGYAETFSVDGGFDTITSIHNFMHDSNTSGYHNSIVMMNGSFAVLAYSGSGSDGYIKVLNIDGSYNVTDIGSLEHDTTSGNYNSLIKIDNTHFMLAYQGADSDGWIKTFYIDTIFTGEEFQAIITPIDSYEFDSTYGSDTSLVQLDSTHYALAYRGSGSAGTIRTFSIDGSYNISPIHTLVHDTYAQHCSMVAIDSTHVLLTYFNSSVNGIAKVFTIDGSYNVSQTTTLTHDDTGWNSYNSIAKYDDTHYILACASVGNRGDMKVLSIDGSYNIYVDYSVTHDAVQGFYNSLIVTGDNAILAYRGEYNDGFVKTFSINI